jgi:general secretion pathway protein I
VRRSRQRGFTLLEVLVALAILSLAVVAGIQGFAAGLRLLKLSGDHQEATLLADQKAREVLAPAAGREEGTEGQFTWTRTVAALEAPDLDVFGRTARWRAWAIDVEVRWGERRVHLATLRTALEAETATPAPGAPR